MITVVKGDPLFTKARRRLAYWKHSKTDLFKQTQRRYRQSAKGKAKDARYAKTSKCKDNMQRYYYSAKGQINAKYCVAKRRAVKKRAFQDGSMRKFVLASSCSRCGSTEKLTMDHVIPLAQGGAHVISNADTLCKPCNSSKGPRTPTQWLEAQGVIKILNKMDIYNRKQDVYQKED